MGSIIPRKRKDGSTAYNAHIIKKKKGKVVFKATQTFDRRAAATAWIDQKEDEWKNDKVSLIRAIKDPTLFEAIEKYIDDSQEEIGKTKSQVLGTIKTYPIANMFCSEIKSSDIVKFANELASSKTNPQPQTIGNYISHLAAVFDIADAAWNYPLSPSEMIAAQKVLRRLKKITKSKKRDRRPTTDEVNRIIEFFHENWQRRPKSTPMHKIVAFAIFSTRRQEEITRIKWTDLKPDLENGPEVVVRDMKHPGDKAGNDVSCKLTREALLIINSMPKTAQEIFPYNHRTISSMFTRACKVLNIIDLRFHDLRHDGASRLFEVGESIEFVARHTGHRSWSSLQRYTHVERKGDKYSEANWRELVDI